MGRAGSNGGVFVRRNVQKRLCTKLRELCTPQAPPRPTIQHHTARHGDHKNIGAAAGRLTSIEPAVDTAKCFSHSLHCQLRPLNAYMHYHSDSCVEVNHVLLCSPNHHLITLKSRHFIGHYVRFCRNFCARQAFRRADSACNYPPVSFP